MSFDRVEDIIEADLLGLVGNAPERKRREYKRDLPNAGSDDRKEFIADVSAFANTEGGDIFYGISEDPKTHVPLAIDGIPKDEAERQITILENVVRDCIRPRIPRYAFHPVPLTGDKVVLVIRVGESHLKPHQSTLNHRFYARNTNGKYPLEVSELADIISRRETLPARMRQFRKDRISLLRLTPEDAPHHVDAPTKLVVHYLPEQSFGRFDVVDVGRLGGSGARQAINTPPVLNVDGVAYRPNMDGFMYMNGRADSTSKWYAQIFYDGTIELVHGFAFRNVTSEQLLFHPNWIEEDLVQSLFFARQVYDVLGIDGRISLFVSAIGIRDHAIYLEGRQGLRQFGTVGHSLTIGRDPALFNEVTLESIKVDARVAIRPIADQLCRAGGLECAPSYDKDGTYIGYERP